MLLTAAEQAMLAGDAGRGVQKAMEIVVALGKIYGAARLVSISSAQVSGVSYKNLGDAGLEFLQEWARAGARVRVPTTLNPAGMDLQNWRELGIAEDFARKQLAVVEAFTAMGVTSCCTCTPYLVGNAPRRGAHVAWGESSAVSYANSVLGAYTNREGGPSALAAAITGRTAAYGLHLDENRVPTHAVDVRCPLSSEADFGALGYLVGRRVQNGIPYFRLLDSTTPRLEDLKILGAAMAASGAVALYYVAGREPPPQGGQSQTLETVVVDDLAAGYAALNGDAEQIDLVAIGCPHASLAEIGAVADYLAGRRVATRLWVTTARETKAVARARGLVEKIEQAGGRVVADTCLVVAPVAALGIKTVATNSAKAAFYAPSYLDVAARFGTLEQCLAAAVRGKFR